MNRPALISFYVLSLVVLYGILTFGIVYFMHQPFYPALAFDTWDNILRSGQAAPQELRIITLTACAVGFMMILFNPYLLNTKSYGDARWASWRNIKKMGLNSKTGMILGKYKGKFLRTKDYLSVIFIAPPNSMKSVGIMIPNLLSIGDSTIAYDVKYDLFNKTSKRRSEFSEIFRFSPADPDSARFNPLAKELIGEDWNDIVGTVESLVTIIYPEPKSGDTHWVMGARNVFIFFTLMAIHEKGETSIPKVRETALETASFVAEDEDGEVLGEGTHTWILAYLDENEDDIPKNMLLVANDLIGRPQKEFGSVFSTFSTGLNGFADERCANAFSACDFSPKSMRETRQSIYLCIKNKDSKRFAIPMRIVLETFADYFLSIQPSDDEQGITYFIDEFPRLGKMDVIFDAPAFQRSNRVRTIFACQDEAQVAEIYGRDKVSTFKSSCAFHVHVAQNTDELNKKISESSGFYTAKKKSYSISTSRSTSHSEEKRALILPQEVGSMPAGDMLLHVQGFRDRPIKARLALFFEDKRMLKMIGSIESVETDESKEDNTTLLPEEIKNEVT